MTKKNHILVVMACMSPAVITELVYALAKENDPPDEVHVVTTEEGQKAVSAPEFDRAWKNMLGENHLTVKFGPANIHCLPDENAGFSKDITTDRDNWLMADELLKILRRFTEDDDTKLSFSIAGGRKSMSAVGALALSLVGREKDRLYHILVNHPFDQRTEPTFYYPSPGKGYTFEGRKYDGSEAVLKLAEIPYVRCRYLIGEQKMDKRSYSALVEQINRSTFSICLDVKQRKLYVNDRPVRLNYVQFLLYWMFAERHKQGKPIVEKEKQHSPVDMLKERFLAFLAEKGIGICAGTPHKGKSHNFVCEDDLEKKNLTRIINKIRELLGQFENSEPICLTQGYGRYGLAPKITPEQITFKNGEH